MLFRTKSYSPCMSFKSAEDGVVSSYGVIALLFVLALGGYAVDTSNVMTARTELQITADAVAHAALVERERKTAADARTAALAISSANLPIADVGQVIRSADIVFGDWNAVTRTFVPREASRSGVQVTARQNSNNGNPVATYMLKIVGFNKWDVSVASTFTTYRPSCLREGFVANGVVDLQSNNSFTNGFCIHSNEYVSLNSNNTFEPGTIVSMTSLDDLELPNSGYKTNIGLSQALREGSWNIRILQRVTDIIAGIQNASSAFYPKYLTSATPIVLNRRTVTQADLIPGRIHTATCTGGASLTIDSNVVVDRIVLVTSCQVKFNSGVILTDSVIASTSTSARAITSVAGLQVGKNDSCALGGEAQLVTLGSMSFPSALAVYGSQLLAIGDITFAAQADGVKGAQMIAGGVISGTSNMTMGFCGNMENANFQVDYFKMVN